MFERMTERARKVLVLAQEEARHFNHNYIGTEHILLGLVREGEGVGAQALSSLNVTLDEVRKEVEDIVGHGEEETSAQVPFTPRSKKVLELALRESLRLGHNYIGTEHILLALVRERDGIAARILVEFGLESDVVRREVIRRLGGRPRRMNPNPFASSSAAPVHDELPEERRAQPKKYPAVSMKTARLGPIIVHLRRRGLHFTAEVALEAAISRQLSVTFKPPKIRLILTRNLPFSQRPKVS